MSWASLSENCTQREVFLIDVVLINTQQMKLRCYLKSLPHSLPPRCLKQQGKFACRPACSGMWRESQQCMHESFGLSTSVPGSVLSQHPSQLAFNIQQLLCRIQTSPPGQPRAASGYNHSGLQGTEPFLEFPHSMLSHSMRWVNKTCLFIEAYFWINIPECWPLRSYP